MVQDAVLLQELRNVRSAGDAGGARRRRGRLGTERALCQRGGGRVAHKGTGEFSAETNPQNWESKVLIILPFDAKGNCESEKQFPFYSLWLRFRLQFLK